MYVITTETPEAGARRLWERVPHDTICEQTCTPTHAQKPHKSDM